jgi:YidC/Oxa1 family membrane protein insertase
MDRTAWVAVVFCAVGLVVWYAYMAKQSVPRPNTLSSSAQITPAGASPSPSVAFTSTPFASPVAGATPSASPTASVATFAEARETLRNSDVELHLTNRGGGIAEAVLLKHKAEQGTVTLNSGDHTPIGAILENPAAPNLPEYKSTREGDAVRYEYTTPEQVTIRKKYSFAPANGTKDNYLGELDIDLQNGGSAPYANGGYYLALGAAAPIHQRDYAYYTRFVWSIDGHAKDVNVTWFGGGGGFLGLGQHAAQSVFQQSLKGAEWAAVSSQFFATIIAPLTGKADSVWARRYDIAPEQKLWGIEGAMHMPAVTIPPGGTYSAKFDIFTGPKLYHTLARLEHNEAEIMNFGIFKLVSQFLLNFMNWLHSIFKDYAIAILALTTVIRLVLWPVQAKANRSMKQTAALAPKMQELRDKYKDDPTKMNQEVMKLYKQYGINPVGGCLPMVIQIPIFFGLYQMLGQAVELRNEKFLWVRDLSQPDTVAHIPGFGWPINILPLCMAATQVWLMQMTPKTGDPTQRRVMMFTPLIFMFICYNFAAALALYYTAQNLFSILQFYQTRNQPMPALTKVTPPGKAARRK